jgi:hypothetical protein
MVSIVLTVPIINWSFLIFFQVAPVFTPQQHLHSQQDSGAGQMQQAFAQYTASGFSMGDPNQGMNMWGAPSQPLIIDDIAEDDIQVTPCFDTWPFIN